MDIVARYKRLKNYNVLFPFGWDAFGLPTENYAIKNKIHPNIATKQNIALSKNAFSKYVLKQEKPFDDMDFSEFSLVFDLIDEIYSSYQS